MPACERSNPYNRPPAPPPTCAAREPGQAVIARLQCTALEKQKELDALMAKNQQLHARAAIATATAQQAEALVRLIGALSLAPAAATPYRPQHQAAASARLQHLQYQIEDLQQQLVPLPARTNSICTVSSGGTSHGCSGGNTSSGGNNTCSPSLGPHASIRGTGGSHTLDDDSSSGSGARNDGATLCGASGGDSAAAAMSEMETGWSPVDAAMLCWGRFDWPQSGSSPVDLSGQLKSFLSMATPLIE